MDFKTHLKRYLSEETISNLLNTLEDEPYSALILNFNKFKEEDLLSYFPNLIKHPLIDYCYIFKKSELSLGKHFLHDLGAYYISEPSAVLVSHLLDIKENDLVLDMCAAPGGKCIQAALKAKNGLIIANDISTERSKILASNVERMGLNNVVVTNSDLSVENRNLFDKFDKIILDAPCSGSGMFRKENKMKDDWSYQKVLKCKDVQKSLIENAIKYLKPGGKLIYSTCSYSYEEDEEIILELLENNTNIKPINIPDNKYFYKSENLKESIHIFPHLFNGEGHFMCILEKDGELTPTKFKEHKENLNKYDLSFAIDNYNSIINNYFIYLCPKYIDLKNLKIIRYGVLSYEIKNKRIEPLHHLAKTIENNRIEINETELLQVLKGETINKNHPSGWYILSFKGLGVSLTKITDNVLKNHYPKGLRRN